MSADAPTTEPVRWPKPGDPGSGPNGRWTAADVKGRTLKWKDAWWTVLFVDPLVAPAVAFIANRTPITPNVITVTSLLLGLACAGAFWLHTWTWLLIGALLYHLSFTLDCMDGKVARLKGNGSAIGGLLDYIFDRIRVVVVTLGLFGGQFHSTGQARYLYAGIVAVFLDALRYMDALQIAKVRREMSLSILGSRGAVSRAVDCLERLQLLRGGRGDGAADEMVQTALADGRRSVVSATRASARLDAGDEEDPTALPTSATAALRPPPTPTAERAVNAEISTGFNRRLPWYPALRDAMLRRRIRTHLVSGVEFQMFVFIVGPAVHQVLPVMIAAGAGLLGFELVILVKLAMATRDFVRLNIGIQSLAERLDQVIETVDPDGTLRHQVQAAATS
jgi:phosphatidylglycerophosphate synthase